MADFRDYYELLNVGKGASEQDIRNAVRTLRKRYRLLEGSSDQEQRAQAEHMMSLLDEAERILLDASARAQYDAHYESEKQNAQRETESRVPVTRDVQSWLKEAEDYFSQGQYSNAYFAAKECTDRDPNVPAGWIIRGICADNLNRLDEAEFSYTHALKLDDTNAQVKAMLGVLYASQKRFDLAKKTLLEAIELDPSDDDIKAQLADVVHQTGDVEQAIRLMRDLHSLHPENEGYKVQLAFFLCQGIEHAVSRQAGMIYITNERQINYVDSALKEISLLKVNDSAIAEAYGTYLALLDGATKRQFVSPGVWYWVLLIIGLIFTFGTGGSGVGFGFIILLALGVYAALVMFPPTWKLAAKVLGSAAKTTGLQ